MKVFQIAPRTLPLQLRPVGSVIKYQTRIVRQCQTKALIQNKDSDVFMGVVVTTLLCPPVSWGAELEGSYDPSTGSQFLVNAAGLGYVLLVAYFLFRVLSKRAKRYRKEKLSGAPRRLEEEARGPQIAIPEKKLTPVDGLIGVLQSAAFTAGLFIFTTKVDALLLKTPIPEQYTAHNIAITVRTIIRGFCYLFTFIFGMNCIGLTGLTIKLIVDPDSVNKDRVIIPKNKEPKLPKISVVSDPEEVARAFDEAARRKTSNDES